MFRRDISGGCGSISWLAVSATVFGTTQTTYTIPEVANIQPRVQETFSGQRSQEDGSKKNRIRGGICIFGHQRRQFLPLSASDFFLPVHGKSVSVFFTWVKNAEEDEEFRDEAAADVDEW